MPIILLIVLLLIPTAHASCDDQLAKQYLAKYQWLAEDYPPYNYVDDSGVLVGIFTDVLQLIYQELGLSLNHNSIQVVPWARLYHALEQDPKYAGFSMVGTLERQDKFSLISLPVKTRSSIMVLNENLAQLALKNINDLTIAVVREDIGQKLLSIHQIEATQVVTTSAVSMLKMLAHKRVDAIAYAEDVAKFQYQKLGLDVNSIVPIFVLEDNAYSNYVFHKNTPQCVLTVFNKAIKTLDNQGWLDNIWHKYLPNLILENKAPKKLTASKVIN